MNDDKIEKATRSLVTVVLPTMVIATTIGLFVLPEIDERKKESERIKTIYSPEYTNKVNGTTRVGSYRGHYVEISNVEGTKINLYYTPYTPNNRGGFISGFDYDGDGIYDNITENNLSPNGSLREFAKSSELEKAHAKVMTNGFYLFERRENTK